MIECEMTRFFFSGLLRFRVISNAAISSCATFRASPRGIPRLPETIYFLPKSVNPFFSAGAAAGLRRPGRPAPKEESAAGLLSFLANAGLANVFALGAGAASFLKPNEKPFLAGGSGTASFLPKENRPPAFLAPPLALLASIYAFFTAVFLLYSSAGMLGPKPPSANTLVEAEALAALAALTGRAATAEVKERADMVMGSVRFVVVP